MSKINIILNGETKSINYKTNIPSLIEELELEPRSIAIELNLEILPKSLWQETILQDGDKLEIVQFVGGG